MSYFKIYYLFIILPLCIIIYNIIPKKFRYIYLLLASLAFFFFISNKLIIILLLTILSTYLSGVWMDKIDIKKDIALENASSDEKKIIKEKYKRKKKFILISCILFNLLFLIAFKYLKFFTVNINLLFDLLHINYNFKLIKLIAPIGISFWMLIAISYIIDVYNNKIKAEKNILKLSLYISFFARLIEGPIVRYSDSSESLFEGKKVTYDSLTKGYQRIIFGLFKKMVIADRLNILVKIVFDNYLEYNGISSFLAISAYMFMLYMEFSGTMDIVLGTADIFNIKIVENFRQPFFAKNISEFWTRWHISLGTWFKDYIFYPISLSKPIKRLTLNLRKVFGNHFGPLISGSVALFIVWFLNGLWHGAGWTYLVFGMYHFLMILLGNMVTPLIIKVCSILHINRENKIYRIFQSLKMTILVIIGETFFRAPTLSVAFTMIKKIFTNFTLKSGEFMSLGLDKYDYIVLLISFIFIFIISLLKEKNIDVRKNISKKHIVLRWALYYILILFIFILGAYGHGYVPVDPMYADF